LSADSSVGWPEFSYRARCTEVATPETRTRDDDFFYVAGFFIYVRTVGSLSLGKDGRRRKTQKGRKYRRNDAAC